MIESPSSPAAAALPTPRKRLIVAVVIFMACIGLLYWLNTPEAAGLFAAWGKVS